MGMSEGNRPIWRPRSRRGDNSKINFKETVWSGKNTIHLVESEGL
jgi:hypothetical protein